MIHRFLAMDYYWPSFDYSYTPLYEFSFFNSSFDIDRFYLFRVLVQEKISFHNFYQNIIFPVHIKEIMSP